MKYLLMLFLSSILLNLNSQNISDCNCTTLLIPKQIKIPIYIEPYGKIINRIINDTIIEDYNIILIKKQNNGFSYVEASGAIYDTSIKKGWIETRYLGIYTNVYSGTLKLYFEPDTKSKVKSTIIKPPYDLFNVIECKNEWLYIKYLDKDNKIKEGWLAPENQCSNPYTTCN